ncbi:MAG: 5-(carboxyamino)imidazole ribonucleotide synthase [Rhodospirillaceae bacterium]|jgi:5-(carboxyamino)imidazole ribonucleotide synthase
MTAEPNNVPMKTPLPIGSVLGIIGGGQLGRMTAIAATRLGYRSVVLSQSADDPAASVAHHHILSDYTDRIGLQKFADLADVVTYELEQLPLDAVQWLAERVPVVPDCRILEIAQDRISEKTFLSSAGIPTADWRPVRERDKLLAALGEDGRPAVFKVAYGGYDGKGQAVIDSGLGDAEVLEIWDRLSAGADMAAILEQKLDFECELSVIVARDFNGDMAAYDPAFNVHKNHILDTSTVPAPIDPKISKAAQEIAYDLAAALDLVGLICLELFLMPSGEIFANEIAPRPHNSGHWTLDAAYTDQFEQVVRATCGLPLGNTNRFIDARMQNIIGEDANNIDQYVRQPNAKLHMYGKRETRPGRKMGHVTFLGSAAD